MAIYFEDKFLLNSEEWYINTEQPGSLPLNIIKQDQN